MVAKNQQVPILELYSLEDGKKQWVAEITGDDPTYRLKRSFLPEISANHYQMYDGLYQINGFCPGISPFKKEYCLVKNGSMTRRIPYQKVLSWLPAIKEAQPQRIERIRQQIYQVLDEIKAAVPSQDEVEEAIDFQKEQVDEAEDEDQLRRGLGRLLKNKEAYIARFTGLSKGKPYSSQ